MSVPTKTKLPDPRSVPAYNEGRKAFMDGLCEDDCPYPPMVSDSCSGNRVAWFTGYFDCRTGSRLADVFRRNGISWP